MLTLKTLALSLWLSVAGFFGYVPHTDVVETPVQSTQTFSGTSLQPSDVALFSTTLVSGITPSDTSMTLASAAYNNGASTLASSTYMFVIGGTELVLADCTGTVCTNMSRGLDWANGTSSVTSLKGTWRRGDSVKITTASMVIFSNIFKGKQDISNLMHYSQAFTYTYGNREIVTYDKAKDYADSVALAGAPNTDETTKGVAESGTAIEQASSTLVGSTGARTLLQTRYASSSPVTGCNSTATVGALCVPVAQNDGKISPNYIATSSSYTYNWGASTTFSGILNSNSTSTFNATSTHTAPLVGAFGLSVGTTTATSSGNLIVTGNASTTNLRINSTGRFDGWASSTAYEIATSNGTFDFNSSTQGDATASCTSGKVVIGGGVGNFTGGNQTGYSILSSYPVGNNSWRGQIRNGAGTSATTFTTYAICVLQ